MVNEKSLKNLKGFKKGHKLSPGRELGSKNHKTVFARLLAEDVPTRSGPKEGIEALCLGVFVQALKGNLQAYDRVMETVFGKPVQSIKSDATVDLRAIDLSTMTDEQIMSILNKAKGDVNG